MSCFLECSAWCPARARPPLCTPVLVPALSPFTAPRNLLAIHAASCAARSSSCTSRWQASTRSGAWTPPPACCVSARSGLFSTARVSSKPFPCSVCDWRECWLLVAAQRRQGDTSLPTAPAANFSGSGYERNQNGTSALTTAWAQPSGLALAPGGDAIYVAGGWGGVGGLGLSIR